MKKNLKTIIIFGLMAILGLSYYFYISNKMPDKDSTDSTYNSSMLDKLLTMNLDENYPESAKEIVKLYAQISMAYYDEKLTDEQLQKLASQARRLFDAELLGKQTDAEYLAAVRKDVEDYHKLDRIIANYTVGTNFVIKYKKLEGREYAIVPMRYIIRQKNSAGSAYHSFKLRKDNNGDWKILYWEKTEQVDLE